MTKNNLLFLTFFISSNLFLVSNISKANEEENVKPISIKIKKTKITSQLKTLDIKGFTIIINFDSYKNTEIKDALLLLEEKLDKISKIIKPQQLIKLKEVPIWIELELNKNMAMCYHPSKEWLINNGYPSEKEKSIEITNLKNFVSWQKLNQPYMVLHEFAHSYHDRVLGFDNPKVLNAYQIVLKSKIYENVEYNLGGKKRSYALTNEKEYFAELTESYLGENDFYPYNKIQLKTFDPIGYDLMKDIWD